MTSISIQTFDDYKNDAHFNEINEMDFDWSLLYVVKKINNKLSLFCRLTKMKLNFEMEELKSTKHTNLHTLKIEIYL